MLHAAEKREARACVLAEEFDPAPASIVHACALVQPPGGIVEDTDLDEAALTAADDLPSTSLSITPVALKLLVIWSHSVPRLRQLAAIADQYGRPWREKR